MIFPCQRGWVLFFGFLFFISNLSAQEETEEILASTFSKEISELDKAILKNDKDASLYAQRAEVKWKAGNNQEAASDLNKAFELNPDEVKAYQVRLKMLINSADQKTLRSAKPEMEKVLGLAPAEAEVLALHASYLNTLGDPTEALKEINKVSASNSSYVAQVKGDVLAQLRRNSEAISAYKKAIETDPNNTSALYGLAKVQLDAGLFSKSIENIKSAIKLNKSNSEYWKLYGKSKSGSGDHAGAVEAFNQSIEINNSDAETYFLRGEAQFMTKEFDSAIADFDKHIGMQPSHAEAYNKRAFAKLMKKDKEGACDDFKKAVDLGVETVKETLKNFCDQ